MFKDIELSHDLMTAFDASKQRAEAGNFDLNVRVLSQASWPTYPPAPLRLPEGVGRALVIAPNVR